MQMYMHNLYLHISVIYLFVLIILPKITCEQLGILYVSVGGISFFFKLKYSRSENVEFEMFYFDC